MERTHLLIIDDDEATLQALTMLLSRRGWVVTTASTIAEGLRMLLGRPSCVILDLALPDGGGEVILREVRATLPRTRVAVCSGSIDPAQLDAVRRLEPDLMLAKPIDLTQLHGLVAGLSMAG